MKKIYSATITPLDENCRIDAKSAERIWGRNIKHGINGFFLLGSMGEGVVMPEKDADELIKTACDVIKGRAEVLVGLNTVGFVKTLQRIEHLSRFPVDSYVVNTPGLYDRASCPVKYILELASRADKPLYIYYLPSVSGSKLSIAQLKEILSHSNIRGLKNSSGDMYVRRELLMLKGEIEFELYEGQEWCIDEALILGCDGALVGMATLASKIMVQIAKAIENHEYDKSMETQNTLIKIFHGVYGPDVTNIVDGHKYALYTLGLLQSNNTLYKLKPLQENEKRRIINCINTYRDVLD